MDSKTEPASEAKRIETEADKYVSKLGHSMERSILLSGYMAGAITEHNRAQEEIIHLKAELERERETVSIREAQQDVMAVDTVRLLDQIEYQNKQAKESYDKIKKLEFELERGRELRKELVNCIETYVDLELFANPKPIESLIKKAKN